MSKPPNIPVKADMREVIQAINKFARTVNLMHLSSRLPQLTDEEWRKLRDREDRRRG